MRSMCVSIASLVLLPLLGGCFYYDDDDHHHRHHHLGDAFRYHERNDHHYGYYGRPQRHRGPYECD